jgi:hypothetical protein
MRQWIKELDSILRGEATRLSALRRGSIEVSAGGLCAVILGLGLIYGLCMGAFALFKSGGPSGIQFLTTTLKVPALFFLTLFVTLPSLYVFNALVGSRLSPLSVWRLLIASLAVTLAVLASLGPIVAFFSVSTTSYSFMILLNVLVYAVSGLLGLMFLLQTLHRLSVASDEPPNVPPKLPGAPAETGALDKLEGHVLGTHVKAVFRCWVVVFALVGAQMAWVLRPFLGNPAEPFTWFRPRGSNFFEAVLDHFSKLLN